MKKFFLMPLLATAMLATLLFAGCTKLPEPVTSTAPMPEAPGPVGSIPDVDVTEHVNMALKQSDMLKTASISVVTLKGDVRLIGVLDSQAQIDEAIRIARGSVGAHTVHDELKLKK
jgi:osmotically-inducible protein OsmY